MATQIADIPTYADVVHRPQGAGVKRIDRSQRNITLLESGLPYKELSLVAKADRRAVDPVYATHRWWARRPPGVIRALLLASALPESATIDEFWAKFASPTTHLQGFHVHDMFAGGGAMLVEAARLGATASGTDIDPLAVDIIRHELNPPSEQSVLIASESLLANLQSKVGHLFAPVSKGWTPLHYFYLHQVCCPHCEQHDVLFRNLVIARDLGKNGGVLRDARQIVFCPDCFRIHQLKRIDQVELRCCGRRHKLAEGTVRNGKYRCKQCGGTATHRELKTGISQRQLLAIEETSERERRRIRAPRKRDVEQLEVAASFLEFAKNEMSLPDYAFGTDRLDSRPVSFGITKAKQLFTDRQLAVFGGAFAHLNQGEFPPDVERALRLTLSNALTTNNKLCSYATDYGRLAPLFSVRSYSLPSLAVELNPFHESAGRGTLPKAFRKMLRSTSSKARRYCWSTSKGKAIAQDNDFPRLLATADIRCATATQPLDGLESVDICLFDPPYFDYIAYSELSEFYRAWRVDQKLGGKALLPSKSDPSGSFGQQLGQCLNRVLEVLKPDRPLAFTFHSLAQGAWKAIGIALDAAGLVVTAIWPVLNDAHMGHHGSEGNCEWDLVVVCRRAVECTSKLFKRSVSDWCSQVKPLRIGKADRKCMQMALNELEARFAEPRVIRS